MNMYEANLCDELDDVSLINDENERSTRLEPNETRHANDGNDNPRVPLASSTRREYEQQRQIQRHEENVNWERELLRRERELLRREREMMQQEFSASRNAVNESMTYCRESSDESLPEFDPAKKTLISAKQWAKKVENVASIFRWDQRIILFRAIGKLKGAARFWFESCQENISEWNDFKIKLIEAFPTVVDEVDIHHELSTKRKKMDEPYETYVYEMKAIASKADISEQAVTKYIISGLDDRELMKMLAVQRFETTQELLQRIKTYEGTMRPRKEDNFRRNTPINLPKNSMNLKCYNCNEIGHKSVDCNRSQRKRRCNVCNRVGHFEKDCPTKTTQTRNEEQRRVNQIRPVQFDIKDEYHKIIDIDGYQVVGFIDLGSDVVTLTQNAAENLRLKYLPYKQRLIGFGGGECLTIGKRRLLLTIEGIQIEVDVIIVPNASQDDDLIIGRSALDQPGIQVVKEGKTLTISRNKVIGTEAEEEKSAKVEKISRNQDPITYDELNLNENLEEKYKVELYALVNKHRKAFAKNLDELGSTNLLEMSIEVTNNEPVRYRAYRHPYTQRESIPRKIDELLATGVIRESTSEYSSPVLLVGKKTGGERLCVDYRKVNAITKKENIPTPNMEEQLDQLAGKRFFTTLDLASGYYQIPIAESSKHITSFVTTGGQYEFNKVPFGLTNAPSVFNRLMKKVVDQIGPNTVTVYMDDMLIATKTEEEGLRKLETVLKVLVEIGLTLKPSKCEFLKENVDFLGYEINKDGVKPGDKNIRAIQNFKRPENVQEIRQFIGLTGFFRKFIEKYAHIARPLIKLTRKDVPFQWDDEQEHAYQDLKQKLINKPILTLYDPDAELEVHTDASSLGVAGILLQKVSDSWKPVCYFSRQTTDVEAKYHSHELETLAVVESLERFRIYIFGRRFKVVTDCNSLRTMDKKRDLIPRIARWWLKIQEYDFCIEHRANGRMQHVDALSRSPVEPPKEPDVTDLKIMKVQLTQEDWLLTLQLTDPKLKQILQTLKKTPTTNEEKQMHTDYEIINDRLCRRSNRKWVVPKPTIPQIIKGSHDDMGHYALEKTIQHLQKYFWFPKMRKRVKNYITSCVDCAYYKHISGKQEGELHNIERIPVPFHTVNMDHLGPFPTSSKKNTHVLALTDNFTKYVYLKPCKNTQAAPVCKAMAEFVTIFGCPTRIITDRGTAFTAKSFEQFCIENDIVHVKNATATPRANGQIERHNLTIANAIKTMSNEDKTWDENLNRIQFAMNSMQNKPTRKSPNELLFGYHPRNILQNKVILALEKGEFEEIDLNEERMEALLRIEDQQKEQKERYDKAHKRPRKYEVGDLVLVKREAAATGQPKKLTPRYKGPYLISEVYPNDRYLLTDIPGAERTQRTFRSVFSTDRMKPWCTVSDSEDDGSRAEPNSVDEQDSDGGEDASDGSGAEC